MTMSDRYPNYPGYKARDTSRGAADGIAPRASIIRAKVIAALRGGPKTNEEVASATGVPLLNVRPRMTELARSGTVVDSGERGRSQSGHSAVIWRLVDETKPQTKPAAKRCPHCGGSL